ncbi:rRNA-processing protein UTP23 homolog [Toxorhynchites rutilus septentrionalis]|uniref:rRNA-processing protein UTP23 homolog n=1 Tax=Toxorhynchites rutilus septentrionalis TaxID=329112 RepID=UPI00247AE643|nr:rRNA-processing protein UTP23 homolog [Toxorhynchites rutilus septentrionalis]
MKVTKHKKARKYMSFYMNNFGFREPLLVLIDGTFCHAAYKARLQIEEQLKRYFQCELKLIVTACIITETENIGGPLVAVCQLLKKFLVHKCGHEKHPIPGSACIRALTKTCNYIVATQDRDLQDKIRSQAGIPLFYLHNNLVPTLVQPSEASVKAAASKTQAKVQVREVDEKTLSNLKKKQGLLVDTDQKPKRRKKMKNPNPLSCKKSKKQKSQNRNPPFSDGVKDKVIEKKKRKRVKLPKHVIEHLKSNKTSELIS